MSQNAYLVDLGTLIFEGEYEFDAYSVAYDKRFGYYDDNQYYVLDEDQAIAEAEQYLSESGDRTYAIVTTTWLDDNVTQQDILDGNVAVEDEHYLVEDAIFAKANIDGECVDLF